MGNALDYIRAGGCADFIAEIHTGFVRVFRACQRVNGFAQWKARMRPVPNRRDAEWILELV